jgi:hypothetical protein
MVDSTRTPGGTKQNQLYTFNYMKEYMKENI